MEAIIPAAQSEPPARSDPTGAESGLAFVVRDPIVVLPHPERFRVPPTVEECIMRVLCGMGVALVALLSHPAIGADELKSGPDGKIGGSFTVKAITGGNKGKSLCYV